MKNVILLGSISLLFFSCSKESFFVKDTSNEKFESYTIYKGDHYCDKSVVKAFKESSLSYIVKFDSTAIYATENKNNQLDINKLFGFSDHSTSHHENSARFGWRWNSHSLWLFAYIYRSGERSFEQLAPIEIGKEYRLTIHVRENEYQYLIDDLEFLLPRESGSPQADGYLLWPYFGGDEVAPHDINIWMQRG